MPKFFIHFKIQIERYSIRPTIYTIIVALLLSRLCDGFHLSCEMDLFTGYFLIWQIMSVMNEWESERLPLSSLLFYRGLICVVMGFMTYAVYDFLFRYFPMKYNFLGVWVLSLVDM